MSILSKIMGTAQNTAARGGRTAAGGRSMSTGRGTGRGMATGRGMSRGMNRGMNTRGRAGTPAASGGLGRLIGSLTGRR